MKPLIDADILVYQAAFGGEDRESGEVFGFDNVGELIDKAIATICAAVYATETPSIFLTGGVNFRNEIAVTKPYKGGRKEKPFHYKNARAYIMSLPGAVMTDGIEADDAMAIEQTSRIKFKDTVICTRDKDLRQVPGFHYGWEHYLQPEFFMKWVDPLGYLEYDEEKNKISGTGSLFFCSQLITGDPVDNIPGLPRKGPKKAYDTLKDVKTEEEAIVAVAELYKESFGDFWKDFLLEQGRLLWMVRELDAEGKPVMWEIPEVVDEL